MTPVPPRPTFGEFMSRHAGPKWVFASRSTERIKRQYPDAVVITPKRQKELRAKYQNLYGSDDDAAWRMLCALRGARLMLYAWNGVRHQEGHGEHIELNETIQEIEDAIAAAEGRAS